MFNIIINNISNSYSWIEILSALLTPTIAIVGGHIAYQQWLTSEKSRKLDLFEKRYDKIFEPILEVCNKTIKSIKDDQICNIEELNELHNTKLSNIEKYSFLLKENDYVRLLVHYGAIREFVRDYKIHSIISQQDKDYMNLKLLRIYDMRRKYLSIEDEKYHTLWELTAIVFKKFYRFFALDRLISKIKNSLKRIKKKKVANDAK